MSLTDDFLELSREEIIPKLHTLASQKDIVKIWVKGETPSLFRVMEVQDIDIGKDKKIMVTFFSEGEEADNQFDARKVLISFSLNDLDYFTEGKFSVSENDGNPGLLITGQVYRCEKRASERLLTFPHHQVYAYFRITVDDKEQENVVPLQRSEDQEYIKYKNKQKEELLKKVSKKLANIDDLVGFRVMDISGTGIAFTISKEEHQYFEQKSKYNFIVLFDGEIYKIKGGKRVYLVDFLETGAGGPRYKIGLHFDAVTNLSQKIYSFLESSESIGTSQREFEKFLDD
jgi:hypothetical protein